MSVCVSGTEIYMSEWQQDKFDHQFLQKKNSKLILRVVTGGYSKYNGNQNWQL